MSEAARAGGDIEGYYRLHHRFYDLTRWSFLFGRRGLIQRIAASYEPRRVLEVGCGTGTNLWALARRFPDAELTGLDLSGAMLEVARQRLAAARRPVTLVQRAYDAPVAAGAFDLVLFSYALSMFNPGWDTAIESALQDLAPGGLLAVVDFHDTPFAPFREWMGYNHVRMEGHLLPRLEQQTRLARRQVRRAYGGAWRYFQYMGTRSR